MASKENLTALKTLVISMGFLLVGGTVLLAGIVWNKVSNEAARAAAGPSCAGGTIDLKGQGALVETMVDGQTLRAKTKKNNGKTTISLIDICKGTVISSITLETDG
jgi:hypothetical protein